MLSHFNDIIDFKKCPESSLAQKTPPIFDESRTATFQTLLSDVQAGVLAIGPCLETSLSQTDTAGADVVKAESVTHAGRTLLEKWIRINCFPNCPPPPLK